MIEPSVVLPLRVNPRQVNENRAPHLPVLADVSRGSVTWHHRAGCSYQVADPRGSIGQLLMGTRRATSYAPRHSGRWTTETCIRTASLRTGVSVSGKRNFVRRDKGDKTSREVHS